MLGYSLNEIRGQHHRIFCEPHCVQSREYNEIWQRLRHGQSFSAHLLRLARYGLRLWLDASYVPVRYFSGNVQRVIKVAFDVNERTLRSHTESSFMQAVDRSMALVEFDLCGQVINANSNFLNVRGFVLEEIRGETIKYSAGPTRYSARGIVPFRPA